MALSLFCITNVPCSHTPWIPARAVLSCHYGNTRELWWFSPPQTLFSKQGLIFLIVPSPTAQWITSLHMTCPKYRQTLISPTVTSVWASEKKKKKSYLNKKLHLLFFLLAFSFFAVHVKNKSCFFDCSHKSFSDLPRITVLSLPHFTPPWLCLSGHSDLAAPSFQQLQER